MNGPRVLVVLVLNLLFLKNGSQVPVAHACNFSSSGDRDQKDLGSKPALGK
jgi:hypothetical protein